jgi:hypothetical protein
LAPAAPASAATAQAASVQATLDAEATGYDRIEAPPSRAPIGKAAIAAAQAAFDSVGDRASGHRPDS